MKKSFVLGLIGVSVIVLVFLWLVKHKTKDEMANEEQSVDLVFTAETKEAAFAEFLEKLNVSLPCFTTPKELVLKDNKELIVTLQSCSLLSNPLLEPIKIVREVEDEWHLFITKNNFGYHVEGDFKQLKFGFDLVDPKNYPFKEDFFLASLKNLSSSFTTALEDIREKKIKEIPFSSNYEIVHGWFNGKSPSLPLFNQEIEFHGQFDRFHLSLFYELKKFHLEEKNITFSMEPSNSFRGLVEHYIDLTSGYHLAQIPITNGSFYDKNTNIHLSDIQTKLVFENFNLHMAYLEGFLNGIYLEASADFFLKNFYQQHSFDANIVIERISGKFSSLQNLLSPTGNTAFIQYLPIEGDLSLNRPGRIHLVVNDNDSHLDAYFKGSLKDGLSTYSDSHLSLQELNLNFEYDHLNNKLELQDLQGTLLVGEAAISEEYTIAADTLSFNDYSKSLASFDFWIGNKKRDIIRLAGDIQKNSQGELEWVFDKVITHFGDVKPKILNLRMKNWQEIKQFTLDMDMNVSSLFKDIQRLGRTSKHILPKVLLARINRIKKAAGAMRFYFDYQKDNELIQLNMNAQNISLDDYLFDNMTLDFSSKNHVWQLKEMRLDDLLVVGKGTNTKKRWKLQDLHVSYNESFNANLQGQWLTDKEIFKGKILTLDMDLKQLPFFKKMMPFREFLSAKGEFNIYPNQDYVIMLQIPEGKCRVRNQLKKVTDCYLECNPRRFKLTGKSDNKPFTLEKPF